MRPSRTDLARRAVAKAAEVRDRFDVPPQAAVNVLDMCGERFAPPITVRFKDISMEGVYLREDRPEIWLGLRPLTRRVFNCAHELGHHVFGHGSTLDELQVDDGAHRPFNPDEYLVNMFAAYLLMPRLAVASAFTSRGWRAEEATPEQCFVVSCSLGVGYETLATHLAYGLQLVSGTRSETLLRTRLPMLRQGMLGHDAPDRLTVIDAMHTLPTVDTEVGTGLLLPAGTELEESAFATRLDTPRGRLFQVLRSGVTRAYSAGGKWAVMVRAMPHQYVGLARYRHLAREDGDDE
ncbi:MAG TPA: ImmA/IrrE family metallo-endopeptidase [Gemmataceae bacterium]|jgi:hypothetical protein